MSKEVNEPVACPHCNTTLHRLDMQRYNEGPEPMWVIRIAGRMNADAIRGLIRALKGWVS